MPLLYLGIFQIIAVGEEERLAPAGAGIPGAAAGYIALAVGGAAAAPAPGPLVPTTTGARGILAPPPRRRLPPLVSAARRWAAQGLQGLWALRTGTAIGARVDSLASLQLALDQIRAEFNNKKHRDRERSRSSDHGDKKGKSSRKHRS